MTKKDYFLLSLYDKESYADFVKALSRLGEFNLLATAGTADWCRKRGVKCETIEDIFKLSPRLQGQVKTLHPDLYTALLGEGEERLNIKGVAVDLTPFHCEDGEVNLKKVDIGGVSMLRAAAKNYRQVLPVVDRAGAELLIENYPPSEEIRRRLARKAIGRCLSYDAEFAGCLDASDSPAVPVAPRRLDNLRYGENPHQAAAFYGKSETKLPFNQVAGEALSYTNCLDLRAAFRLLGDQRTEATMIKHTNPTGWAAGERLEEVINSAWAGDPKSAYGGVLGLNRTFTAECLEQIEDYFIEVVVAPGFENEVVEALANQTRPRLIEAPPEIFETGEDFKSFANLFLYQSVEARDDIYKDWKPVSERSPTEDGEQALKQMWRLVRFVTSNAAVVGTRDMALGVGAGQQSRVDAVKLATQKLREHHPEFKGRPLVLASDGFFPFPDNVEMAAEAGIDAIVVPGGSIRDEEVIAAANQHGICLVFAGRRLFSH